MGLHGSQKGVVSGAGSFPLLNNSALILGFPGLSSVDIGREGDCVHTLSQLVHLRHLFPPVFPHLRPCVLDPECQPRSCPQGPSSWLPFSGGGGGKGRSPVGRLCTRLCVCVAISCEIRMPNKSGINLPTIFVPMGKKKKPHRGIVFSPLVGYLCPFNRSIM